MGFVLLDSIVQKRRDAKMRYSYLCGLSRGPQLLPLEADELEEFCISEKGESYKPVVFERIL